MKTKQLIAILSTALILTACGGGSASDAAVSYDAYPEVGAVSSVSFAAKSMNYDGTSYEEYNEAAMDL